MTYARDIREQHAIPFFTGDDRVSILNEADRLTGAFHKGLTKKTKSYLKSRGVTVADIVEFGWGSLPQGTLKMSEDFMTILRRTGMLNHEDQFRAAGCPVYPLRLPNGMIQGWQVRTWGGDYYNYLLNKFVVPAVGFDQLSTRFPHTIFLAEGWFDWYPLQRVIPNVVSFLTAGLAPKHINVLRRYTTNIVPLFDRSFFSKRSEHGAKVIANLERSELLFEVLQMPSDVPGEDWSDTYNQMPFDEFKAAIHKLTQKYL